MWLLSLPQASCLTNYLKYSMPCNLFEICDTIISNIWCNSFEICDQFSTPQSIFFMGLHFLELTKELKKYKMKTKPAIRRPFTNLYLYYELYLYFHQYL